MNTDEKVIAQMKCWIETVIIELNICPFARHEFVNNNIHYQVQHSADLEQALFTLADEFQRLGNEPDIETTLLIFPDAFSDFEDFLTLIDYANELIDDLDFRSTYQLAHFHPLYCFEGSDHNDAANYTNRAPSPTLHLIREASLQQAIENHSDTADIPETNIKLTRQLGLNKMQGLLDNCLKTT
ncbi:hypothetical protein MNBD_GAMMA09-3702 [hydrothermal vent metagenome]|uniref:DUF1415 domain-containing protein n=1 Tax=hydrothermal vent metagenome TaxID=652676 RepID=A0A3B0XYQ5_9ZZZZ